MALGIVLEGEYTMKNVIIIAGSPRVGVYEKGEILKTKFPTAAYKLGLKVK